MAIEIVDLPTKNGDFPYINHHFPMVFPWFSHGFSHGFPMVCHGGTWHRRSDGSCVCRVTQRGLLHWAATAAAIEEAVKHSRLQPAEGRRKGAQGGVVRMFIVIYIYINTYVHTHIYI